MPLQVFDFEKIRKIFRKRSVGQSIYCTLTPELEEILWSDAQFTNAENRLATVGAGIDSRKRLPFRGVNLVSIEEDTMPYIDTSNIGLTAPASNQTLATEIDILCRDFGSFIDPELNAVADKKVATDRVDKTIEAVTTTSADLIYLWTKEALLFTKREANTFLRESERADARYADQVYYRVDCGAVTHDNKHILAVALRGRVKKA